MNEDSKYVNVRYQLPNPLRRKIRRMKVRWGFGSLSEFIYYSHYSRVINGKHENWPDTVLRCVDGTLTIIVDHMLKHKLNPELPKSIDKFDRMMSDRYANWASIGFDMARKMMKMKMVPAGRGLWGMGELAFSRGSMVLNNCGAVTTLDLYNAVTWTMGALMYGCGIGFDTEFNSPVVRPNKEDYELYVIPDTREGWVESVGRLISAYVPSKGFLGKFPRYDYSKIRPRGSPIRTFGGTASGPEPLQKLHQRIEIYFDTYLEFDQLEKSQADMKLRTIPEVQTADGVVTNGYVRSADQSKIKIFETLVDRLTPIDFSDPSDAVSKAVDALDKINLASPIECIDRLTNIMKNYRDDKPIESDIIANIKSLISDVKRGADIDLCMKGTRAALLRLDQPEILRRVEEIKMKIRRNIDRKNYDRVRLTVDIMNAIGTCVVAGNVRRSSMLAKGRPECKTFPLLKDYNLNPERMKIAYMSNNSLAFTDDTHFDRIDEFAAQTMTNGEPGYIFVKNAQNYGRIRLDPNESSREVEYDYAIISNPCSEIFLGSYELCLLVEMSLNRFISIHDSSEFDEDDFQRVCILATIYAKASSILPTNDPKTNAIVKQNHRVGISITGAAQVYDRIGRRIEGILERGYATIRKTDRWISKILCVRESIRVTTCKPSGTISLLTGSTPGIHFSHSRYVRRRVRMSSTDKMVPFLIKNGFVPERDVNSDNTLIFSFALDYGPVRSVKDVSMVEQLDLLEMYQRCWADNMVSVTVTFDREREGHLIASELKRRSKTIKSVSFLPRDDTAYPQMPLEEIDYKTYLKLSKTIDWSQMESINTSMPRGCTNETCIV